MLNTKTIFRGSSEMGEYVVAKIRRRFSVVVSKWANEDDFPNFRGSSEMGEHVVAPMLNTNRGMLSKSRRRFSVVVSKWANTLLHHEINVKYEDEFPW